MKNSLGTNVILTIFGESHGAAVGAVLDGVEPGIAIDKETIAYYLDRRRPCDITETARVEKDEFSILSGVFNGFTTGSPICIVIPNDNTRSEDYQAGQARPSHADYVAHIKYGGFEDYRGGGHFSGRITAGIVAAGAIAIKALEKRNVHIATHILKCGSVTDSNFSDVHNEIELINKREFPVIGNIEDAMKAEILKARNNGDSVGGIVQTAVAGLPAGVGEPWFDSLEGMIAKAVFSIGGVKGVEFGAGFGFAGDGVYGSNINDSFFYDEDSVKTRTNNNGGINGGISNGMPVIFNTADKPTPSISKPQHTIDFIKKENIVMQVKGRHDPAIIRRICPVITAITAITIYDLIR